MSQRAQTCNAVDVGKRRDGGTRYWCLTHRADCTAKYGVKAAKCRYADVEPVEPKDTLRLSPETYNGGVAIWGAVPPVYDTTLLPIDRGIHVHARRNKGSKKELDTTFRLVDLDLDGQVHQLSELDAIYFMVSSVFGFPVQEIRCTYCQTLHLDRDWFSVHQHRRHLCAACGRHFRDSELAIGNPVANLRSKSSAKQRIRAATKILKIDQADFPGGVQIWGSNQAILWTGTDNEEAGIHVHAFDSLSTVPLVDDTYAKVSIDGVQLDPLAVRTLMAQRALPHLAGRILSLNCVKCQAPQFDTGVFAYTPRIERQCTECGACVFRLKLTADSV